MKIITLKETSKITLVNMDQVTCLEIIETEGTSGPIKNLVVNFTAPVAEDGTNFLVFEPGTEISTDIDDTSDLEMRIGRYTAQK